MAEYLIQDATLTAIADAIRARTGTTDAIAPLNMPEAISEIPEPPESEEITVPLNMADGDMVVTPSDGKVISKATVQKPETLVPENIANGIDIAGIVGTLIAGTPCVVAFGSVKPNGQNTTITHNLGVIPDIFIIHETSWSSSTSGTVIEFSIRYKTDFVTKFGLSNAGFIVSRSATSKSHSITTHSSSYGVEQATTGIGSATQSTVEFKSSGSTSVPVGNCNWIAIGGLT